MPDLKGKVALVAGAGAVGAGWGNGKATEVLLARQGAKRPLNGWPSGMPPCPSGT